MNHNVDNSCAFDPLHAPIKGTSLIEASAGTGKTWNIAALYLRLILQEKRDVAQILVVTYTRAATAELKTRLRSRISQALYYAQCEEIEADDFLRSLFDGLNYPKQEQILRLQAALNHFDKACIYTIHGFCQRVLQEFAFACASPFEVELVSENDEVLLTLTEDFWREKVSQNPLWAKLVFTQNITPQDALYGLRGTLGKPYLHYQMPQSTLVQAQQNIQNVWAKFNTEQVTQLEKIFWDIHPLLNGNKYRKTTFERLFARLAEIIQTENVLETIASVNKEALAKLSPLLMSEALKKGNELPGVVFSEFAVFIELIEALNDITQAKANEFNILLFSLYEFLNQAIQQYNRTHRQRRFDDLLLDLHQALERTGQGQVLTQSIAQKWQVALIDEFQDTDPIQYQIFQRVFGQQNKPLFLVGDPKQAIYKFRGADVFAYLEAARCADYHYSLPVNFRSHQALVGAVSILFMQKQRAFVLEQIEFNQVVAQREEPLIAPLTSPLTIQWLQNQDVPEITLTREQAKQQAADACAASIVVQLTQAQNAGLCYQGRALQARDIAVLVSTHNQAKLIQDALKALNVDSVSLSQESVFASLEADALLLLLTYWQNPTQTRNLRLLLTSLFFNYNAKQLYTLNQDDQQLLQLIEAMQQYQTLWQQKGVLAAYTQFDLDFEISSRLLACAGERTLTNLAQLLELLSHEEKQHFSMHNQIQWLGRQIEAAKNGQKKEAAQLRLESDENLIKIITIHSSKGLQYPVVYCPFLWDSRKFEAQSMNILHQHGQSCLMSAGQMTETSERLLKQEEQAEKLRLLYVALTRAQEQLVITLGDINGIEQTATGYLLLEQDIEPKEAGKALKQNLLKLIKTQREITLQEALPQAVSLDLSHNQSIYYQARQFTGKIKPGHSIASFSGLSSFTQAIADEDIPKQLDLSESISDIIIFSAQDEISRFTLPKGNKTGLCLHDILENLDFQTDLKEQLPLIEATLEKYQLEAQWLPVVVQLLEDTLQAQLSAGFSLAQCPDSHQLKEMGFMFRTESFNPHKLLEVLANPFLQLTPVMYSAARMLNFYELNGFCNGFIDLIAADQQGEIYVIDYKSNHLGNTLSDYQGENLNEAIAEHHYYLQAILYAIATYRYFKLRGKKVESIHIRYLFMRGLETQTTQGIWQWDLNQQMIELLESVIKS